MSKKKKNITVSTQDSISVANEGIYVNREYNSSVFKMYFSIKKNAVELYNALNGTSHTEDELTINTLDNAVFLKIYNDVSFVISGTVNLYEHQSTVNPNMPLRDLFYVSDMYKPYGIKNDLYGSKLIKIPTPKFVVFYNGNRNAPDDRTLKLSDSFEQQTDNPELELSVRVLNVNYGHNEALMEKCVALKEFAILNQRVRDNLKDGMNIKDAATVAVDSCIDDNIMADFLIKEKAGVIKMHVLDYNEEKHSETLKQEGYEAGLSQGISQGISQGVTDSVKKLAAHYIKETPELSQTEAIKMAESILK